MTAVDKTRMARVYQHAVEMIGDRDRAMRRLNRPNRTLGGDKPIDQVGTDAGGRLVEDLLGRIAYGVCR